MNLSRAYGEGATLAYLLTYVFFVNVNLEVSSVLSSKNYICEVLTWFGGGGTFLPRSTLQAEMNAQCCPPAGLPRSCSGRVTTI